ncbi:hypothetical protein ACIQOV_33040 [Kitasatospora sp. NPDC091257]|uniref:hypothetical protein n=1 Tax=Kitasatospora sp. NPDC091257 TaxID=3364084 RepID=UPI0037FB53ED
MDLNLLFTDEGMRAFTAAQRDAHRDDALHYGQLAAIVRSRLEQTAVEGDGPLSAKRRAGKVARHLKALERASSRAAAAAEALYASYVGQVLELPVRRQSVEARKQERRDRRARRRQVAAGQTASWAASSLHRSAAQLGGQVPQDGTGQGAQQAAEEAPVYLPPQPAPFAQAPAAEPAAAPSIAEFFLRKEAR